MKETACSEPWRGKEVPASMRRVCESVLEETRPGLGKRGGPPSPCPC